MELEKLPKVMEFCDELWNFTNFAPELYQICALLLASDITKFSIGFGSPHFTTFAAKCREWDIEQGGGHGK